MINQVRAGYIDVARELMDFFAGTYAVETIEKAIESRDDEILKLVVQEYASQKQLIEEEEQSND